MAKNFASYAFDTKDLECIEKLLGSDENEMILRKPKRIVTVSSPIKSVAEINLINELYRRKNQIRNLLMFDLAINMGLDLAELFDLKVKDVKDKLYISNGKQKSIPLNDEIRELISQVIEDKEVDALLLLTERNEFRRPDMGRVKSDLKTPLIFDCRKQYNSAHLKELGFEYVCMGKGE